jgi:hypothetical protein
VAGGFRFVVLRIGLGGVAIPFIKAYGLSIARMVGYWTFLAAFGVRGVEPCIALFGLSRDGLGDFEAFWRRAWRWCGSVVDYRICVADFVEGSVSGKLGKEGGITATVLVGRDNGFEVLAILVLDVKDDECGDGSQNEGSECFIKHAGDLVRKGETELEFSSLL